MNFKLIKNFIDKLSPRERLVFYGAVAFVGLAVTDNLMYKPITAKMEALDREITVRESEIRKNVRILLEKDRINSEMEKYGEFLKNMPTEEQGMTSLLKEIEGLSSRSSVYVTDVKPSGIKVSGASKKYQVTLNFEAEMLQVAEFIHVVEDSNKFLTVENFQISPKSKDSSIAKVNMVISKLLVVSEQAKDKEAL